MERHSALILPVSEEAVKAAAQAIREGRLIGFPTETVYGIGANALDEAAVKATFALKRRPADNPLIVHVATVEQAKEVVNDWPPVAAELAERFWPGPLTMVLPRRPHISDLVTGGRNSVAVRIPGLAVARDIVEEAGVPITAPSANPFMSLSPTYVEMFDPAILAGLRLVVDAGPCNVGIESTVVDLMGDSPVILRPGVLELEFDHQLEGERRSPGMYLRHYAPSTRVELVESLQGRPGVATDGREPSEVARNLYSELFELDRQGLPIIYAEVPPDLPQWRAIRDRMVKAASPSGQ